VCARGTPTAPTRPALCPGPPAPPVTPPPTPPPACESPSLADTGSVYFDTNGNAAAGFTNDLFNGSFTGIRDVGLGPAVMPNITSGNNNTAIGTSALDSETTGLNNTAIGTQALEANDVGQNNVATGLGALTTSTSGNANLATGDSALELNTTGELNVGDGYFALSPTQPATPTPPSAAWRAATSPPARKTSTSRTPGSPGRRA